MKPIELIKYFKIAVFIMAIVFFTVQAVQAQATDPGDADHLTVFSDQNGVDAESQHILDGDTSNPDGGDTLLIEAGGEIRVNDKNAIEIEEDDNTVINNGLIKTTGYYASGINIAGDDNTITNNGDIDAGLNGIFSEGNDNTFINYGLIKAVDFGIKSLGDDNSIFNYGDIETTWDGIYSYGDDNFITNYGSIIVEDTGINSLGDLNTLINYDTITSSEGLGIKSFGTGNSIFNYATIIAGYHGIYSTGSDNSIFNYGLIKASGFGIFSDGDDNSIFNYGDIEAAWDGIDSYGDDNFITNYGSIIVEDTGIYSEGDLNTLINYGTITSYMGNGISLSGDGNTIANYGSLLMMDEGIGIVIQGTNNEINNYGSIRGYGESFIGISVFSEEGQTNTINNYGSIYATDPFSYAISGSEGNEIVNLFSGSDICGDIDLDEGDDTLNYYVGARVKGRIELSEGEDTANVNGTGRPAVAHTLTFHGAENININNIIGVRNGNTVTTIDPSIQSVKAPALNSFTTGLHNVIIDRLGTKLKNKSYFWADSFNSYRERNSEGVLFKYNQRYNGIMLGYDISNEKFRFGIMAGISDGKTEGKYDSFETDTSSFFGGIYSEYDLGIFRIATALIGGYEDHKDERMVMDNEVGGCGKEDYQMAIADHESYFFSPSITLSRSFELSQRLSLEPSASAVYSIGWYESYEEIGTVNSNLGINDRTIEAFNGKVQLKSIYRASERVQLGVYGGATVRYTDNEDIDGNFGGTGFSYSAQNDDSVYGEQFGAYVDFAIKDNFDLNFKVEHGEMDGDEKRDFVTGGFQIKF